MIQKESLVIKDREILKELVDITRQNILKALMHDPLTAEEIAEILKPRREADKGNDLWKTFNRVQESVMRGGGMFIDSTGKVRKMKATTNIMVEADMNKKLWELAETYA